MSRGSDLIKAAKRDVGTTVDPEKGTFVLPDGELLGELRGEDHAGIAHFAYLGVDNSHPIVGGDMSTDETGEHLQTDLENFQIETGAIRHSGYKRAGVVDVWTLPTAEQLDALKDLYADKLITVKAGIPEYKTAVLHAVRQARDM